LEAGLDPEKGCADMRQILWKMLEPAASTVGEYALINLDKHLLEIYQKSN